MIADTFVSKLREQGQEGSGVMNEIVEASHGIFLNKQTVEEGVSYDELADGIEAAIEAPGGVVTFVFEDLSFFKITGINTEEVIIGSGRWKMIGRDYDPKMEPGRLGSIPGSQSLVN
jgi:hypothetical protein